MSRLLDTLVCIARKKNQVHVNVSNAKCAIYYKKLEVPSLKHLSSLITFSKQALG